MVLFKRKAVVYDVIDAADLALPKDTPCWLIPETQETFFSYENFLNRCAYYDQKVFTCEVSGKTGLSFREAFKSELRESKDVDESFPHALKSPVLKLVQFSELGRLDALVEQVYDAFKHDYFPGENVIVTLGDYRYQASIREKTKVVEMTFPDGYHRPASSRYVVEIADIYDDLDVPRSSTVDENLISRERGVFTKLLIRSFLRNTLEREPTVGAPWTVKHRHAQRYQIDVARPLHLLGNGSSKIPQSNNSPNGGTVSARDPPDLLPDTMADVGPRVIEDLDLSPSSRASWPSPSPVKAVSPNLVQNLLEVWAFYNVFLEVLILDSFTLDDFCDALHSHEPCELIDEMFCSVLRVLADTKHIHTSTESETGQGETFLATVAEENAQSRMSELESIASGWPGLFKAKEFSNDAFVKILIGLSCKWVHDRTHPELATVMRDLVEKDITATTSAQCVRELLADQKLQILSALVNEIWQSSLVRNYIEECMNHLTQLRKDRAELTKLRKSKTDAIYRLRVDARTNFPKVSNSSTDGGKGAKGTKTDVIDARLNDVANSSEIGESDSGIFDEDEFAANSTKRRVSARHQLMKSRAKLAMEQNTKEPSPEEAEEEEEDDGDESAAEDTKKVYSSREDYETEIAKLQRSVIRTDDKIYRLDAEFKESDAQRLRKLGEDRFHNSYFWLESSGMPIFGMPNCSTSQAGFATGRIFVLTPSLETLQMLRQDSQVIKFMKQLQELNSPSSGSLWASYDSMEEMDQLLTWLNGKGERESKLKMSLETRSKNIALSMENRMLYLTGSVPDRRSVRSREHEEVPKFQCWKNTLAVKMLGVAHSGERRVKGVAKKRKR